MSRVGKAAIKLPAGVELKVEEHEISVKGPKGQLKSILPEGISLDQEDGSIQLKRAEDTRSLRERHGLARALLNNNVIGVSDGWTRKLELVGVGYRAQLKGEELVLSLGYSHEVRYKLPSSVKAVVPDQTKIELTSIDKQALGQVASEIRSLRPPEPYKGKGIRYAGENIRRKAGKSGKGKGK